MVRVSMPFAALRAQAAPGMRPTTTPTATLPCSFLLAQERTALHAVALWGTYTMMVNKAILASLTATRARGAAACAQLLVAAGADVNAADE